MPSRAPQHTEAGAPGRKLFPLPGASYTMRRWARQPSDQSHSLRGTCSMHSSWETPFTAQGCSLQSSRARRPALQAASQRGIHPHGAAGLCQVWNRGLSPATEHLGLQYSHGTVTSLAPGLSTPMATHSPRYSPAQLGRQAAGQRHAQPLQARRRGQDQRIQGQGRLQVQPALLQARVAQRENHQQASVEMLRTGVAVWGSSAGVHRRGLCRVTQASELAAQAHANWRQKACTRAHLLADRAQRQPPGAPERAAQVRGQAGRRLGAGEAGREHHHPIDVHILSTLHKN